MTYLYSSTQDNFSLSNIKKATQLPFIIRKPKTMLDVTIIPTDILDYLTILLLENWMFQEINSLTRTCKYFACFMTQNNMLKIDLFGLCINKSIIDQHFFYFWNREGPRGYEHLRLGLLVPKVLEPVFANGGKAILQAEANACQ